MRGPARAPKLTGVKALKASPMLLQESFYAKKSQWAGGGGIRERVSDGGRSD